MRRRDFLCATAALAAGPSVLPAGQAAAAEKRRKVLYFTRSTGHGHPVVYPASGRKMSHSEKILRELGERAGFDVEHTKDGRVFDGDLARFDALVFYSNGSLTAPSSEGYPPVSAKGKERLLDAVEAGKGVVAFHTANASFNDRDPRGAILGGVALGHGSQQEARMLVTSPKFPGLAGLGKSFSMLEEWYAFRYLKKDLHVILVQDTGPMRSRAVTTRKCTIGLPIRLPGHECKGRAASSTLRWDTERTSGPTRSSSKLRSARWPGQWATSRRTSSQTWKT